MLRMNDKKRIEEIKMKIEEIKEKKNEVVKLQRYEQAANLRDREKKLVEELEKLLPVNEWNKQMFLWIIKSTEL